MKDVNVAPGNNDLLSQRHSLLWDEIGSTREKLETLRTAQELAAQVLLEGNISQAQYDAL